jgi:hypothetical protein
MIPYGTHECGEEWMGELALTFCVLLLSLQTNDAAQQVVPAQQGVDSSPPHLSSDRSLDIRSSLSPLLRRSCSRVYLESALAAYRPSLL